MGRMVLLLVLVSACYIYRGGGVNVTNDVFTVNKDDNITVTMQTQTRSTSVNATAVAGGGNFTQDINATLTNGTFTTTTEGPKKFVPHPVFCTDKHHSDGESFSLNLFFQVTTYFFFSIAIIGFVGNVLSFIVLLKDKARGTSMFYLKALAIIDALVCVSYGVFHFYHNIYNHTYLIDKNIQLNQDFYIVQTVTRFLIEFFVMLSSWLLVAISIDRYIAVCLPFKAVVLSTLPRAYLTLTAVTICTFGISVVRPLQFRVATFTHPCLGVPFRVIFPTALHDDLGYKIGYETIFVGIVTILLPIVLLFALNIRLVFALNAAAKMRASMSGDDATKAKADNNITATLLSVAFVFLICMIPAFIYLVVSIWNVYLPKTVTGADTMSKIIKEIQLGLRIVNSGCNFFIYCVARAGFRKQLMQLFCGKPPKEVSSGYTATTGVSKTEMTKI